MPRLRIGNGVCELIVRVRLRWRLNHHETVVVAVVELPGAGRVTQPAPGGIPLDAVAPWVVAALGVNGRRWPHHRQAPRRSSGEAAADQTPHKRPRVSAI
jgi:hypothetical protein